MLIINFSAVLWGIQLVDFNYTKSCTDCINVTRSIDEALLG